MVLFSEAELDMEFSLKCTIATLLFRFWFEHIAIMHFFKPFPMWLWLTLSPFCRNRVVWSIGHLLMFLPQSWALLWWLQCGFLRFIYLFIVPVVCHRHGHDWSWGHRCGIRLTNGFEEEEEKEGQIQWPQSSRVSTFAHPGFFTVSFPPYCIGSWFKYLQELLWWIKQLFSYFHYCI